MRRKSILAALIASAALILIVAACSTQNATEPQADATTPPTVTQAVATQEGPKEHDEEAEGPEHVDDSHGVSADQVAQENPIPATDASIARGAELYANSCAVCHGDTGFGDGVAGKSLDPPPANLHEDHVQILTDGAMFAVIHNGVEGTGMPAFEGVIEEDDIWNLVNFIRTFKTN